MANVIHSLSAWEALFSWLVSARERYWGSILGVLGHSACRWFYLPWMQSSSEQPKSRMRWGDQKCNYKNSQTGKVQSTGMHVSLVCLLADDFAFSILEKLLQSVMLYSPLVDSSLDVPTSLSCLSLQWGVYTSGFCATHQSFYGQFKGEVKFLSSRFNFHQMMAFHSSLFYICRVMWKSDCV